MPFVYDVHAAAAAPYSTHATPNTEDPVIVLRQGNNRGFDVQAIEVIGKGVNLTSLNAIGFRVRRWGTVGTGGTPITPQPRRLGCTVNTTAADKQSAITPGTGTPAGTYQAMFGCGAAGPGGFRALNADSTIHVEGGGADELNINSVAGVGTLSFDIAAEIFE